MIAGTQGRKAQMKMMETISVLIVFFLLLIVGMVFYANFRQNSIDGKRLEQSNLKSIETANRAPLLPEIQCSRYMCIGCTDAIDLIKLSVMSSDEFKLDKKRLYVPMLGYSTISVRVMSANPEQLSYFGFADEYNVYDYKGGRTSSTAPYFLPVNVYNAYTKECYFGVMAIQSWT